MLAPINYCNRQHMASTRARSQARRLYDVFAELARRYQHRDVNVAAYRDLTVSQTHVLERLDASGPLMMGALAHALFKSLSAVTRMIDPMVTAGLVERRVDEADRRICRIAITRRGVATIEAIRSDLSLEYGEVLERVPAAHRESVIMAVSAMLELFTSRQTAIYTGKAADRKARQRRSSDKAAGGSAGQNSGKHRKGRAVQLAVTKQDA
jgi:DNA-binding MarR family transcriptional regulator